MFLFEAKCKEEIKQFTQDWCKKHPGFVVNEEYIVDRFPMKVGGFVDIKRKKLILQPVVEIKI